MTVDPFTDRLTRVRARFAAALAGKIDEIHVALPRLSAAEPAAAAAVAEAYRCVHGIVGVGPTVGFPTSGSAAHDVENVLRPAHRDGRALTADEAALLVQTLRVLRENAARELQSFESLKS